MHTPPTQAWSNAQRTPQAPQFAESVVGSVQAVTPGMSRTGHAIPPSEQRHAPSLHGASGGQALSHAPQCWLLVCSSTQVPPQEMPPPGQAHTPAVQVVPPGHALPHAPQWSGSLAVSAQVPPQLRSVPPPHTCS